MGLDGSLSPIHRALADGLLVSNTTTAPPASRLIPAAQAQARLCRSSAARQHLGVVEMVASHGRNCNIAFASSIRLRAVLGI